MVSLAPTVQKDKFSKSDVRVAGASDVEQIFSIYSNARVPSGDPNVGSIIDSDEIAEFYQAVDECRLLVVDSRSKPDTIVGFLRYFSLGHAHITPESNLLLGTESGLQWSNGYQPRRGHALYVSPVVADRAIPKSGIGRALVEKLIELFPNKDILGATVVRGTIEVDGQLIDRGNLQAQRFHQKMGYEHLGTFEAEEFFGLKNYCSHIYVKRASE